LSTLTKILIILLALSSIFLCGIVVTYVANIDNYRQKYNTLRVDFDAAVENKESAIKQLNENIAKTDQQKKRLNNEIASLGTEISKLKNNLENAERENAVLIQKVNSWTSITKDFYQTTDKQGQLLKNTLKELNNVQAEQIKKQKELNETTSSLNEKMAIIENLKAETKRLREAKSELQSRLDRLLQPIGKTAAGPVLVTPEKDTARPQIPAGRDIDLQGLITAVDLVNKLASISIGSADGVKQGMKFHVTRGDEFICDILILDIDTEESVGILDLVQKEPQVGDNVSTNL